MINLNIEEAKQKTVELLNKKCYSLVRPDFSKYSQLYFNTTENLSYLEKMDVREKDALTVTGSFDQCLNLVHGGSNYICNFDVNVLTIFLAGLKCAALKALNYTEYVNFFSRNDTLNYQMYLKLRPFLNAPFQEYWDFAYNLFSLDGEKLSNSHLFLGIETAEQLVATNPYLKSEKNYNETKRKIDIVNINFEEKNLLEIGEGEEQYDLMFFSNIQTYLVEDYFATMKEAEYLDFIQNKASKQLKEEGQIQVAYRYKYKTKIRSSENFFSSLFKKKYVVDEIDYMKDKYKKVVFTGIPFSLTANITSDTKDCIYIYEKKAIKRR